MDFFDRLQFKDHFVFYSYVCDVVTYDLLIVVDLDGFLLLGLNTGFAKFD